MDKVIVPPTIIFVGKSHSGKTTVAQKLSEKIGFTVIDVDTIDLFTKENYPNIVSLEKANREFYNDSSFTPFLKLLIQTAVFKYSIANGLGVILSNGHLNEIRRSYQTTIAKELGSKNVIICFEIDNEILLERIKSAKKPTKVLTVSKTFEEMLAKQTGMYTKPKQSESDFLLIIDATKKVDDIVSDIYQFLAINNLLLSNETYS